MNIDAINRHLCPKDPIDFDGPGAAMKLAWFWTAQEIWADRAFDADVRPVFAAALKKAWPHVQMMRESLRRQRAAATNERVRELQRQRDMLQNKPFGVSISGEQARIDAQIEREIRGIAA